MAQPILSNATTMTSVNIHKLKTITLKSQVLMGLLTRGKKAVFISSEQISMSVH